MDLKILDFKQVENRGWYLVKANLLDYLDNLKDDFYDFAIQRKIVKNQYLDNLYNTIEDGDPIPAITLTYSNTIINNNNNNCEIDLDKVEILDGLQRTFRLWALNKTVDEYKTNEYNNYREFAKSLKDNYPIFFDSGVINSTLIKNIIDNDDFDRIKSSFENFDIYFTIWTGLTPNEIIKKMLLLNAGQKSVTKTHQFELLFLHFYKIMNNENIKLYREKDSNATQIKKGNREVGEFIFSSIIVSLQSFAEAKALRVSTDKLIKHEFNDEKEISEPTYELVFKERFLNFFLENLYEIDKLIDIKEPLGKTWFSKDTTLNGFFAAIGKIVNLENIMTQEKSNQEDILYTMTSETFEKIKEKINSYGLHLEAFNEEYNKSLTTSMNIGTFVRSVVQEYILELLNNSSPEWNNIFKKVLGDKK